MTKRREDKSNDCGRGISDLEKLTYNGLLNGFQVVDTFTYQGGHASHETTANKEWRADLLGWIDSTRQNIVG